VYIRIFACRYVYINMFTCIHIREGRVETVVLSSRATSDYINACMCVYIRIFACKYVYILTYIHTQEDSVMKVVLSSIGLFCRVLCLL